jgi:serine/threonine protein kinase
MADSDDTRGRSLPRRLGRYILLSRLTGGGMTEVYAAKLAEEVGPGRLLVIKLLPQSLKDDPEAESRFLEEARILLNLTHGNITTAFEFGRSETARPFLVMEYVPGPSLRRIMDALAQRGDRLGVPDALFIVAEVSKALGYAHAFSHPLADGTGIIHRDISPDNVIISTTGQVKLTDFGIAEFMQSRAYGPIFGKAPYVAPEVTAGAAPTAASDLYSLGAVLYECLAGAPPHLGKDDKETLALARSMPPKPPGDLRQDLPEALSEIILSLLDKDPAKRPTSAAEVQITLRALLNQHFSAYTEPDLARTVRGYFVLKEFLEPSKSASLRADLLRAGVALGEEMTTDDLLDGGTIRISEGTEPAVNGAAPIPEKRNTSLKMVVGATFIAAALALGLWLASSEPLPANRTVPSERQGGTPRQKAVDKDVSSTVIPRDTGQVEETPPPIAKTKHPHPSKAKGAHGGAAMPRDAAKKTERSPDTGATATQTEKEWGWLNINSYPWSYVSVDGKRLSGHTPYRRVRLKSGAHELVFENPELNLRTTKSVEVTAFEETNVGVRLK